MSRVLTPGERQYVRKVLLTDRRMIIVGLVIVTATLVPFGGLAWTGLKEERLVVVGVSLAMAALCAAVIVYISRRVKRVALYGQVQRVTGEFRTAEVSAGENTVPVHYVGDYVVTVPEHWPKLIEGQHLEGEVYPTPVMGIDAGFYGTTKKGILLSAGPLFIDREIPLGLLHLPTTPRWADQVFLGLTFLALLVVAIVGLDELRRSVRNSLSGSRQYQAIADFVRSPPPSQTHVQITAASVITAHGDAGRAYYICDLPGKERAALEKLAQVELSRLRLARPPSGLDVDERVRKWNAQDRKPAESLDMAMKESFRRHRDVMVRVESTSDSEAARLPELPKFNDVGQEEYAPLEESFLRRLGRIEEWSGFYDGLRGESEGRVPVLSLGSLDGLTRWMGLLIAPLIITGFGLGASILKGVRDGQIRRRIARAHDAGGLGASR